MNIRCNYRILRLHLTNLRKLMMLVNYTIFFRELWVVSKRFVGTFSKNSPYFQLFEEISW